MVYPRIIISHWGIPPSATLSGIIMADGGILQCHDPQSPRFIAGVTTGRPPVMVNRMVMELSLAADLRGFK